MKNTSSFNGKYFVNIDNENGLPCLKTVVNSDKTIMVVQCLRSDFGIPDGRWYEDCNEMAFIFDDSGWTLSNFN
jgi:hypothetical protein